MSTHKVDKHSAIQFALLLNADGETRTYLVSVIQGAYQDKLWLSMDDLCNRLRELSKDHDPEKILDVLHYSLCLRLSEPVE